MKAFINSNGLILFLFMYGLVVFHLYGTIDKSKFVVFIPKPEFGSVDS